MPEHLDIIVWRDITILVRKRRVWLVGDSCIERLRKSIKKEGEGEMIVEKEKWNTYVEKNKDHYGKCCIDVAREVMKMLDEEPTKSELDTHKLICDSDDNIKAGGITGFMAGCVAQMVSEVHSRGHEFRLAWNKDHGVKEKQAKGGVVNPALMTIETKED